MGVAIQINTAERIRRVKEANPELTNEQLQARLGVTVSQVKAAFAYKGVQKTGRRQR